MKLKRASWVAGVALVVLAGCGNSAEPTAVETSDPGTSDFSMEPAKEWIVDTSGWWLPEDPSGCLNETTSCVQAAWPVREYFKGGVVLNAFAHGETLSLYCKAPTPEAIRNSMLTESVYWYYADHQGTKWWVPDIYVTRDDVTGMADGVPDCPSNTPGVNGRGS